MNQYSYQAPFKTRSTAAELRARARGTLKGRWGLVIGVFLLASILGLSTSFDISLTEETELSGKEIAERVAALIRGNSLDALREAIVRVASPLLSGAVIVGAVTTLLFATFVGAPIKLGYAKFHLDLADQKTGVGVPTLFYGFEKCYWRAIAVVLLRSLTVIAVMLPIMAIPFVVLALMLGGVGHTVSVMLVILVVSGLFVLCSALATVLGIAVNLRYGMSLYIALEYPTLGVFDVLRNSAILMKGNKLRLLRLYMSFFGWILLSVLSFGIGMIWISPYITAAETAFYDEISGRATAKEVEFPSVDPEDYFGNEF